MYVCVCICICLCHMFMYPIHTTNPSLYYVSHPTHSIMVDVGPPCCPLAPWPIHMLLTIGWTLHTLRRSLFFLEWMQILWVKNQGFSGILPFWLAIHCLVAWWHVHLESSQNQFFSWQKPLNQLNPYLSTAKTSANFGEDFRPQANREMIFKLVADLTGHWIRTLRRSRWIISILAIRIWDMYICITWYTYYMSTFCAIYIYII